MRRCPFSVFISLALCLFFLLLSAASETVPPESVKISGADREFEPTETVQLTAAVFPAESSQKVKWESLNTAVATIGKDGVFHALQPGSVYIRAYCADNKQIYGQVKVIVKYGSAPSSLSFPETEIHLNVGQTRALAPEIAPESASHVVLYQSSDTKVCSVSETGVITAKGFGSCVISAKCAVRASLECKIRVTVADSRVPEYIAAYPSELTLEPSLSQAIEMLVLPETLNAELVWKTSDPSIAIVENGVVTCLKEGKCTITVASAYTDKVFYTIPVVSKYGSNMKTITAQTPSFSLVKGETVPLNLLILPENASRALAYEFSDPSVAKVDASGMLVALKYGESELTVYSHKDRKLSAKIHISVDDPLTPLAMEANIGAAVALRKGEQVRAVISFAPDTADTALTWSIDNDAIASIDDSGLITAHASGVCTLTAASDYNPELTLDIRVIVEGEDYTLVMPERRTDIAGIAENLQKIDSVRESAKRMLKKDYENGLMNEKEYKRRLEIIDAAFEMYDFPWMVTELETYWLKENSEDGAKDFKPGIVYYGLPYTSGGNSSRTYNVKHAVESGWYVPSETGEYYIFNRNHELYDGRYAGNDCSAFVSLALFGTTTYQGEIVKTYTLFSDDRLIEKNGAESLRAGDILVRHSIHVVMFLYWADDAHTQAVFIEQGGSEPGINTVSTSVYNISNYIGNLYHIKALRSFKR